jgi:hypothetical protein
MKSIILAVLLIAAIGAGVYFLFFNKKKTEITSNQVQKGLIVGKWKLDSISHVKSPVKLFAGLATIIDSDFSNYAYQFQQDGKIVRLFKDSVQKNSSSYEWANGDHLLFKEANDSLVTKFNVFKLNMDSLVLLSPDSSMAVLTRVK